MDVAKAIKDTQGQQINIGKSERIVSVVAGGLLLAQGLRHRKRRLLWLLSGVTLLYRGLRGHCPAYERLGINTAKPKSIILEESVTVNRPPEEVYQFWRNLENLPRFMQHLRSVQSRDATHSHWIAQTPATATTVEWDAEIVEDHPNELLTWRSLPGSELSNQGTISFQPAPGQRGTEVHVSLQYLPAHATSAILARLATPITTQLLKEEIWRFKNVVEAGETPTIQGQPRAS